MAFGIRMDDVENGEVGINGDVVKSCYNCGRSPEKLLKCCGEVSFCNKECQKVAWKQHKPHCEKAKKQAKKEKDELLCPLCISMFTDPVKTICGHTFCASCLSSHQGSAHESSGTCPACRAVISKSATPDEKMQRLVQKHAPKAKKSSGWKFEGLYQDAPEPVHRILLKNLQSFIIVSICDPSLFFE